MRLKLISFLFVFIAVTLAVFPIEAFKVTGVSLSVSEREYTGFCPHRFTFTGRITTNRGGTVRYRWLRSDGSSGAETALVFTRRARRRFPPIGSWAGPWERIRSLDADRNSGAQFPYLQPGRVRPELPAPGAPGAQDLQGVGPHHRRRLARRLAQRAAAESSSLCAAPGRSPPAPPPSTATASAPIRWSYSMPRAATA